jgi:hypothetical protein
MVDNQHRQIKGYLDLPQDKIDLINRIKNLEAEVASLHRLVATREDTDDRWITDAQKFLEHGFMAFVRSVARAASPFDEAVTASAGEEGDGL